MYVVFPLFLMEKEDQDQEDKELKSSSHKTLLIIER